MTTEKHDDNTVPTLVDVVVPGKTKVKDQPPPEIASPIPGLAKHDQEGDHLPSKAALNAKIEALVTEILVRHMEHARKEIVHRILSEIDTYSVNTSARQ